MAETITIPSPSVFLSSPVESCSARPAPKATQKRPSTSAKSSQNEPGHANGVTKRKQSKSRNGCVTCKAKRLKCDETKPACQQCAKRNVTCGGYKKDFKWRPFEEASFTSKSTLGKRRKSSPPPTLAPAPSHSKSPITDNSPTNISKYPSLQPSFFSTSQADGIAMSLPPTTRASSSHQPAANVYTVEPLPYGTTPASVSISEHLEPSSVASTTNMFNDAETMQSETTAPSSLSSGQSPRLVDLLLPGTDLSTPAPEYLSFRAQYPDAFYQPPSSVQQQSPIPMDEDDDIEEIVRQPPVMNPDHEAWVMRLPSPSPSSSSSSSDGTISMGDPSTLLFQEPQFAAGSPEMLTLRYDRQTCGILSVNDGPTENPWRTLVWPLARDCPALYHAIASMTSFHTCKNQPGLRVQGIDHMRASISALASGIASMRFDTAIATTLALAFSESWDTHTSTGIDHIKGAKILVNQALMQHRQSSYSGEELTRLKFLCNTWVYMDVIARLTSVDADDSNDFDAVYALLDGRFESEVQLDPLMGCAASLFPLIGRVANLVRKVRRSESNSPPIVSHAMALKTMLEEWSPPPLSSFSTPEDPTLQIQDSVQTAEAYRWASLLYLHQAVPEIPSPSSAELAKKVLCYLATVPLDSRAVIVQIYPLTAAGCEAVGEEDRAWVRDRWASMAQRMKIGVIDRCAEVVKEVWDRRDAYQLKHQPKPPAPILPLKRDYTYEEEDVCDPFAWMESFGVGDKRRAMSGAFDLPIPMKLERRKPSVNAVAGPLDKEFTVRGSLHWLSVMKDWKWEILLG